MKDDFKKVQECFELLKKNYPNAIGKLGYLETPIGWNELISSCAKEIQEAIVRFPKSKRDQYGALQIKEKFGGLCWSGNYPDDSITSIIKKYEKLSYKTCEVCGKDGKLKTKGGWYDTLCKDHEQIHDVEEDDFFLPVGE